MPKMENIIFYQSYLYSDAYCLFLFFFSTSLPKSRILIIGYNLWHGKVFRISSDMTARIQWYIWLQPIKWQACSRSIKLITLEISKSYQSLIPLWNLVWERWNFEKKILRVHSCLFIWPSDIVFVPPSEYLIK